MIFINTIIERPYVFLFLIAFLVIGFRTRGIYRTLIFLVTGYLIAWISEASSIRTGFPYGWYFYIYENLQGEWLNFGVPVWDSLSYVFLCFAGLSLAEYIWDLKVSSLPRVTLAKQGSRSGYQGNFSDSQILDTRFAGFTRGGYDIFKLALTGALFTTLLDIVIDPLAHLGDQWFLGKIYYYPDPGFYFDVPLSNFGGWFLVSFIIVGVNLLFDRFFSPAPQPLSSSSPPLPLSSSKQEARSMKHELNFWHFSGPLLYFGIFLFNWIITLWLHQWLLAVCDLVVMGIPGYLFVSKLGKLRQQRESGKR